MQQMTNYCFLSVWPCGPLAWWSSAAAWAQALLTVGTFIYAIRLQERRDRRDWSAATMDRMVARERDLRRENRELEDQVAATRTERLELQRQTSLAKLHLIRFARQLRHRIAETLAGPYESALAEIAAVHALTDEIRGATALAEMATIPEFVETGVGLLISLEATAEKQSAFTRRQRETHGEASVDQYVLDQRQVLQRISDWCASLIQEIAEPKNADEAPVVPGESR